MKNDEIKALENFVAELKKIDDIDNMYFSDIILNEVQIAPLDIEMTSQK